MLEQIFLQSVIKRFTTYKDLGDKTFAQLEDKDFHFVPNEESNSIAVIIQHMHGNMLSRWTDFLTSDGEKTWRQRDAEFEEANLTKENLLKLWEDGWTCMFNALNALTEHDLQKTIFIRDEALSVTDAIHRQLAHYPYHVGQIIYAARIIKNKNWKNLSIPRGESAAFNKSHGDQQKNQR